MSATMTGDRTQTMTDLAAPDHALNRSYIDWAAVIGGAVVTTAIGTIFTTFGAALGLSALSAEPGEGSGMLALVLTAIWLVVTLVASYLAGGYIAGRMRHRVDQASADEVTTRDGLNGLVVWGLGILIAAMMLGGAISATVSTAGTAVGAAATATGAAIGGAVEGAAGLVPEDTAVMLTDAMMRPGQITPATANAADIARQTAAILGTALTTGTVSDDDRAYLVSATTAQTALPPAAAQARVDAVIAQTIKARDDAAALAEEAKQTAIDVAETARISGVLTAFLLAAAALVAGAAAMTGAVKGGQHRDKGQVFGGFSYRG
jgi:hypothetical protein